MRTQEEEEALREIYEVLEVRLSEAEVDEMARLDGMKHVGCHEL